MGLAALLILLNASFAGAFGKNSVRNEKFSWRVLPTDHFDIYYYEEENFLLDWTAEVAEASYDEVSNDLGFDLKKRVPIVIYMSPRHFEQNNISPVSGEAIGGLTEPIKNRLVMPYNGSQRQFETTLHHEMVHEFQIGLLFPTFGSVFTVTAPPDWFMEGQAEYYCGDDSPDGDMILRDAVMSDNLPDLQYMSSFSMLPFAYLGYKLGQSIMEYLVETYGPDAPAELLQSFGASALRRPDGALEDSFGIKQDDLNEDWKVWLRKRYWPSIAEHDQLKDFATQLSPVDDRREYISYFQPNWSPSGDLVACMTIKERFLDIFLVNAETGEKFDNLTKGYALSEYEYILYMQNGLSWSPDGNFIAFVGKKDTFDQIYILNIFNREIVRRYNPEFEDILAPAYSPDGTKIAFAGVEREKRDIYVLDVATGRVDRVTDDFYSEGYPAWSPDGEYIYYASEREAFNNIFRVRPDGTDEEQITFSNYENRSPRLSPDGTRMMFCSNRDDGIYNIYVMDLATREVGKHTDVVTGVMDATWSPDGETVAFTAYEKFTYSLWSMPWLDEPVGEVAIERPGPDDYGYEAWLARYGDDPPPVVEPEPEPEAEGEAEAALTSEAEGEIVTGEELALAVLEAETAGEEVMPEVPDPEEAETAAEEPLEEGVETGDADEGAEAETYASPPTVRALTVSERLDDTRKYGVKFSPDYLNTTFAYTTGGEFTNYTVLGLSDILGSHRIDLLFDLTTIGSFHDIDVAIDYYYLTRRTSYIFSALTWQEYYIATDVAFDRRVSGGSAIASYPLNKRNRVEGGVFGYDRRTDYFYDPEERYIPPRDDNILGVIGAFVRDTTQWGYYHPNAGMRMSYTVRQTTPVTDSSEYYTEQVLDLRRYVRVSDRVSLAFRLAGGISTGRDPQNFYLGGGSNLRGYRYYQIYGNQFGLGSFEFRMPIIDYIVWPVEGLVLGGFRTLFFVDLGTAWGFDPNSPYPDDHRWYTGKEDLKYDDFTFATKDGGWHLVHGKMAFGTGLRWWLGYFDVKLDWGWRTNLREVETPPRFHFTLGYDF
jgi:Tol biopolymer transport system component